MMSILMEQLINITDAVFLGHVGEIELGASAIDRLVTPYPIASRCMTPK